MAEQDVFRNILSSMASYKSSVKKGDVQGKKKVIALDLNAYIIDNKITQEKLAEQIGVSLRQLLRWVHAESTPNKFYLEKMKKMGIMK